MKQVFPKFLSPVTPLLDYSVSFIYFCSSSDYALFGHLPSWNVLSLTLHCLLQYATLLQLQKCSNFYTDRQLEHELTRMLDLLKKHQSDLSYLN